MVNDAKAFLAGATTSLIYSSKLAPTSADITSATPSDLKVVTNWAGPTAPAKVQRDKHAVLIPCALGTLCQTTAEQIKTVIEGLDIGWTVDIVPADGTPQGFVTAFESAIVKKPDVIYGLAVADTAVAAQLAEARAKGIATVAGAVQQAGTEHYDAYLTGNTNMAFAMNAYVAIADSAGKANVLVVHDSTYPNLDDGATQMEKILERCGGCTVYTVNWTSPQAENPVQAQQLITAALQRNPQIDYIIMPYDTLGVSATSAAVRSTGRDIKIIAKDAAQSGLQQVVAGDVAFDTGFDVSWGLYAAVDLLLRAGSGEKLIPEDAQGLPMHVFTRQNTPEDGVADLGNLVDYKSKYLEMWGKK